MEQAEAELQALGIETGRAEWVRSTYVTTDTSELAALAETRDLRATAQWARRLRSIDLTELSPVEVRKCDRIRVAQVLWAPNDLRDADELPRRISSMEGTYATWHYRPREQSERLDLEGLSRILSDSRNPELLGDVWEGWHQLGATIRPDFERYVTLANHGARDGGFEDLGALWRSRYDMDPREVDRVVEGLWREVEPLYRLLHAFVRLRLSEGYGKTVVREVGPIRAHLFGNMWGQSWRSLLPLLSPSSPTAPQDLTKTLVERGTSPAEMVRYGERFFVSLGLPALPSTFWERSMFVRPQDRDVVCHASAWAVDTRDDVRIKMCIEITEEEFRVIHHELGHTFYQLAYRDQPYLFRDGAHDGFHEAVGDTIALSITPEYLVQVGLLDQAPGPENDIRFLLAQALEKVAFLPFGLLVDRWRWKVFSGEIAPADYNPSWWDLRLKYQGMEPPTERGPEAFDAGGKYHVVANVPYLRYFFAHILQFQFHQALARRTGWDGPLHRCSIYGHPEAGESLLSMLSLGSSRPWPEALELVTGGRMMDAGPLREYFRPLESWLRDQVGSAPIGW
ncbi:MAG: M2 family metallopeptidase [Thermoplasmata archaeon]|nr:M2 family metallopeptidase [Thermoplasmata archaeon]